MTHVGIEVRRVWIELSDLVFPDDFNEVHRNVVRDDDDSDTNQIFGFSQVGEIFAQTHLDIRAAIFFMIRSRIVAVALGVDVAEEAHAKEAGYDDNGVEHEHRLIPSCQSEGKAGIKSILRHRSGDKSRKDPGKIDADAEQAVVALSAIYRGHIIGKSPGEDRHDECAPHFRHDVEQRICPVAEDSNKTLKALRQH